MAREPIIGITMGDAAGIGPEIVVKALTSGEVRANCLVIGDAGHFADLQLQSERARARPAVAIHDLKNLPDQISIGLDSPITGKAAGGNIIAAVDLWKAG